MNEGSELQNQSAKKLPHQFNILFFLKSNWCIVIGILSLALPTIYTMVNTVWQKEDQSYGPIILGMVLWMFCCGLTKLSDIENNYNPLGWMFIIISIPLYIIGHSQRVYLFEISSYIPLMAGLILLYKSLPGLRSFWFPLFFIVFLVPLPGFIVDALTFTLKQHISSWAEVVLYSAGYPIARTGVTLIVGQYQLLVADACSGLHSMFSLFALGVFYIYLQNYKSSIQKVVLFLSIAPIAFFANLLRVIILVLITYYFGDEVGQSYIHSLAGIIIFCVALMSFYIVDLLVLRFFLKKRGRNVL